MITINIPLIPTPQRRQRHGARLAGGKAISYNYKDKKQIDAEQDIAVYLAQYRPDQPMEGPIDINIHVMLPVPKSFTKKQRQLINEGKLFPTKKPDLDNYEKNILDCLTRLRFWNDDSQVVSKLSLKTYKDDPGWRISIMEMREHLDG